MDYLVKVVLNVEGMTCTGCENKIESKLKKTDGLIISRASYNNGTVKITYDRNVISLKNIKKIIDQLGYRVIESKDLKNSSKDDTLDKILDVATIALVMYFIYHFALRFGLLNIFNNFPQAEVGMSFGLLFVVGVFTSIHCVAMCGGINLSQTVSTQKTDNAKITRKSLKPSFLYNSGRVVSYTLVGAFVGAVGSVVSFSGYAKGIVAILAGGFMIIMGINMLNIFPSLKKLNPRLPRFIVNFMNHEKIKSNSQFYVGLLNGLMPCGPLQAMQLYALSTGDPIKGALSMFFFGLGTTPLMFGLGTISSILSKKFTNKMLQVSAVLVVVLGFFMFQTGLGVSGIEIPVISGSSQTADNVASIDADGIQRVTSNITSNSYESISIQAGVKTQWTIHVDQGDLSGCNNRILIRSFGAEIPLQVGDNIIEFTPTEKGTFTFTCWMGMIRSRIIIT